MLKRTPKLIGLITLVLTGVIVYVAFHFPATPKEMREENKKIECYGIITDIRQFSAGFKSIFIQQKKISIYFNASLNTQDSFWNFVAKGDSLVKKKDCDSITIIKLNTGQQKQFLCPFYFK